VLDPVPTSCEECRRELAADSPALRLELTIDDELIVYCEAYDGSDNLVRERILQAP
jgi:hypothetical protein